MDAKAKTMPSFSVGCLSWTGVVMSVAIIAIRAFQQGAQPIETWSAISWCLMLLPAVLPFVLAIGFLGIWAIGWIVATAFSRS